MLVLASMAVLVVSFMTCCCSGVFKKVPINYIILLIFTLAEGYLVSMACSMSEPETVLMAMLMTVGITVSLVLYAMTTKTDITMLGASLFIFGMAFLLFSVFALFTNNKIVHIILCTAGIILYGFYLVFDIQLIMGGKKYELTHDDYIIAAIMLYIDIIGLFLEILKLLNLAKS